MLLALFVLCAAPVWAAEKEDKPVGYGGAEVQMKPFMVPYRTIDGTIRYEVLMVRLTLDTGPRERPACFSVPIVHDRMIRFFYKSKLTAADFVGERRKLLEEKLFEVAVAATAKGFYSGAEILGDDPEPMEPKSQTLSTQCN